MKTKIFAALLFLLAFASSAEAKQNYRNGVGYFYESLSPFGEWIEIDYDLYVWKPYNVNRRWKPYSNGRWYWTNDGWYWDSYEPYGWAVYHYGRWFYDDYYGWLWMPDNVWGPAWVEWRHDDFYIGWAPLPPYAHFRGGSGIHFSISWNSGYTYWNFVSYNHFSSPKVHYYFIPQKRVVNVFSRTKYRNDYGYRDGRVINHGVERDFIERKTRKTIASRDIVASDDVKYRRGSQAENNQLRVYRPDSREIERSDNSREINAKRIERKSTLQTDKIDRGIQRRNDGPETNRPDDNERLDNRRNDQDNSGREQPENTRREINRPSGSDNNETIVPQRRETDNRSKDPLTPLRRDKANSSEQVNPPSSERRQTETQPAERTERQRQAPAVNEMRTMPRNNNDSKPQESVRPEQNRRQVNPPAAPNTQRNNRQGSEKNNSSDDDAKRRRR